VDTEGYTISNTASSFEAGTPNIIAAVSLLKALEYIEQNGGMEAIWAHEQRLVHYALPKFKALEEQGKLHLVGPQVAEKRV
jgi:cysteine desulfurase/selenocysteine lyase